MTVVKVGGSLLELPDLRERLTRFLSKLTRNEEVCLLPGGGPAADAVREWDRIHDLGVEASHWLAIQSMTLSGLFLADLLGFDKPAAPARATRFALAGSAALYETLILNVELWMREHDTLPHSWAVTSDSIAALVAIEMKATKLVMLKSVDVPATVSWEIAAANGWVDDYFPQIAPRLRCPVQIINLRSDHFDK